MQASKFILSSSLDQVPMDELKEYLSHREVLLNDFEDFYNRKRDLLIEETFLEIKNGVFNRSFEFLMDNQKYKKNKNDNLLEKSTNFGDFFIKEIRKQDDKAISLNKRRENLYNSENFDLGAVVLEKNLMDDIKTLLDLTEEKEKLEKEITNDEDDLKKEKIIEIGTELRKLIYIAYFTQ